MYVYLYVLQMSTESSSVPRKRSSTKSSPCPPFAVCSLDLSLEQSSLRISESCESQRRTQTFSTAVHRSKVLQFSTRSRNSCCHSK